MGDNHFTGCAYGLDHLEPFTGPCDCPVCNGAGFEPLGTTLPHSGFGDPACCGCLVAFLRRDSLAEVICNECQLLIRTAHLSDLSNMLTEMELTLDSTVEMCPVCRYVNIFTGFSRVAIYTRQNCGKVVAPSHDFNAV